MAASALPLSSSLSSAALRELVESAVESGEVAPLVKLAFEAGEPGGSGGDASGQQQREAEAGSALVNSVLELLTQVADDKEAEISQICRSSAAEIAGAMQELGAMQRDTAVLRQQLLASNSTLQAAGSSFARRLEEVQEAAALQQGVAEARQAVSSALQVLQLCARAAKQIESKQLYKAYKTLEAIQRDHAALLRGAVAAAPAASAAATPESPPLRPAAPAAATNGPAVGATAAAAAAGSNGEQLGALGTFLRERVAQLSAALEARAVADFNNWLASVRAQARTIGQRAVRWAAAERQQEEQLARQRKLLLPRLEGVLDLAEAGRLAAAALRAPGVRDAPPPTPLQLPAGFNTPVCAAPPHAATPASSGSSASASSVAHIAAFRAARQAASSPTRQPAGGALVPGSPTAGTPGAGSASSPTAAAAAGQTPLATAQMRRLDRTDTVADSGDLLAGVDMAPLHRCAHIHACLGRLQQFAEYYTANRRQQLATDLALQGDFLEHYQGYLTQIVGYFLVEDAVSRAAGWDGAPGGESLDIVAQVDAAWDAAVASLKAVLEPAFSGASAAAAMLTVKDFLLLVCLALDHCGYHTVAIREVLLGSRAKYHELLAAAAATAVQAAVAGDSMQVPVEVASEARARDLFGSLALPATFQPEDAGNKKPPFRAPFTPCVPEIMRVVRGYIVDSVAYLKGLLTPGEVPPAARQHRDRMLSRVVVTALQRKVDAAAGDPQLEVTASLQLVANIAALMQAVVPLDEFALAQARGETAETAAAAAAAVTASRSPSPGRRGRSRSPGPVRRLEEGDGGVESPRGWQMAGGEGGSRGRSGSAGSSHGSAPSPSRSPACVNAAAAAAANLQQQQQQQQPAVASPQQSGGAPTGSQQSAHTVLSFAATGATTAAAAGGAGASGATAVFSSLLGSAEALVVRAVGVQAAGMLAAGAELEWAPSEQRRSTAYSPYVDELIMWLKECSSLLKRMAPPASTERMLRCAMRYLGDAFMLQLLSDAVQAVNIFGLQRLYSDLGGISRVAGSMGIPGLGEELGEPLLFCELMVFGTLEDVLRPEMRAEGGRLAGLDLRRVCVVLDKYRELDKASGFAAMHKSKQAERFISKKTVDRVLKELREVLGAAAGGSRPASRSSSVSGGGPMTSGVSVSGDAVRRAGSVTGPRVV